MCDLGYGDVGGACQMCQANTYKTTLSDTACLLCPNNTVNPNMGSTVQSDCGTFKICSENFYNIFQLLNLFHVKDMNTYSVQYTSLFSLITFIVTPYCCLSTEIQFALFLSIDRQESRMLLFFPNGTPNAKCWCRKLNEV